MYCLTLKFRLGSSRAARKDVWELTRCTRQFQVLFQLLFPFRNNWKNFPLLYNGIFQLNVKMIGTLKLPTPLSAWSSKLLSSKVLEKSGWVFVDTEINL